MQPIFTAFLLIAVSLLGIESVQNVRGVAPESKTLYFLLIFMNMTIYNFRSCQIKGASLYDPNKKFQCLDGSSFIPFSQVNDDYCDCKFIL
jgi:hypothetical protein